MPLGNMSVHQTAGKLSATRKQIPNLVCVVYAVAVATQESCTLIRCIWRRHTCHLLFLGSKRGRSSFLQLIIFHGCNTCTRRIPSTRMRILVGTSRSFPLYTCHACHDLSDACRLMASELAQMAHFHKTRHWGHQRDPYPDSGYGRALHYSFSLLHPSKVAS